MIKEKKFANRKALSRHQKREVLPHKKQKQYVYIFI